MNEGPTQTASRSIWTSFASLFSSGSHSAAQVPSGGGAATAAPTRPRSRDADAVACGSATASGVLRRGIMMGGAGPARDADGDERSRLIMYSTGHSPTTTTMHCIGLHHFDRRSKVGSMERVCCEPEY